jgi:hypothetical protein
MYKLTLALTAFAFVAAAGGARADDSGHIDINSLTAQMPRDDGPTAPVSDDYPSSPTACSIARGGLKVGCTVSPWRAEVSLPGLAPHQGNRSVGRRRRGYR